MTFLSTSGCLAHGTQVLLYDGVVKAVEHLAINDVLMGMGSARRRIMTMRSERGALYRVTPSHGPSWLCGGSHVLALIGSSYQRGLTVNVGCAELLKWTSRQRAYWRLWRSAVDFPTASQRMDPYFIGLWLGDGTFDRPEITSMDQEVITYCKEVASAHGLRCVVTDTPSRAKVIRLAGPHGGDLSTRKNTVHDAVRDCAKDGHKHIPFEYLIADRSQRFALLAGLLDTDGCLSRHHFSLSTSIHTLSESIVFLARSLGLAAYAKHCRSSIKATGFSGMCWRIHISGDLTALPTKIARKRWSPHPKARRTDSPGFSLESAGDGALSYFTLDGEGAFFLDDFTVSGLLPRGMEESSNRSRRCVAMPKLIWDEAKREASKRGMPLTALVETALSVFFASGFVPADIDYKRTAADLTARCKAARTVSLDHRVYETVKREAAHHNMPLSAFIQAALSAIGVGDP